MSSAHFTAFGLLSVIQEFFCPLYGYSAAGPGSQVLGTGLYFEVLRLYSLDASFRGMSNWSPVDCTIL